MLDYSEERSDLVPAGSYEATAICDGQGTNNFGDEVIRLSWKIREDVQQESKGRLVFDDIGRDKNNPEEYNDRKIYDIIYLGQKGEPGAKLKFDDYDELAQYINGLNMIIDVEIKQSNSGRKYNRIKFGGYHPSQAKGQTLVAPKTAAEAVKAFGTDGDSLDITDDDLPF